MQQGVCRGVPSGRRVYQGVAGGQGKMVVHLGTSGINLSMWRALSETASMMDMFLASSPATKMCACRRGQPPPPHTHTHTITWAPHVTLLWASVIVPAGGSDHHHQQHHHHQQQQQQRQAMPPMGRGRGATMPAWMTQGVGATAAPGAAAAAAAAPTG